MIRPTTRLVLLLLAWLLLAVAAAFCTSLGKHLGTLRCPAIGNTGTGRYLGSPIAAN